ncbi:multi-copper polyphenol oxidoreductase laccase-domain-containing protein [Talaromyces proteolyticus]|uniref:Multi-copper polyphenol oxidoreductase laccase-domain-containing protein n=1 Tax=Talaromyces proteolyticus TaxID=1131652 RepID=A0AAD4PWC7_9EURO|nr:multi-copper polyphenol oxidoreductase laccase-domain-containing protein [Talaromyces proteolyticus]KAH8694945.1 multi-copper polyphenol oxidoreductase laccase-domain-containing protein [Talaromyces proteolyticus]
MNICVSTRETPAYTALPKFDSHIGAAYTGKGTSPNNHHFSFRRPSSEPSSSEQQTQKTFQSNLAQLSATIGFNPSRVTLPNGPWPHSGQAIIAESESFRWIENPLTGALMPVTSTEDCEPVTYDGIVTKSKQFVLGIQGADCPSIFLYDPEQNVISIAHAGWKPLVRGVVANSIRMMEELGAQSERVVAYVSPGCGDRYNCFHWDEAMESHIKEVFTDARREEFSQDHSLRYVMTDADRRELEGALGREIGDADATTFCLTVLVRRELEQCGVRAENISWSDDSTVVTRYKDQEKGEERQELPPFQYHSYRRERPEHGLSMGVLFLKN